MMRAICSAILATGLTALSMAGGKPLGNKPNYDGKFFWLKLGELPAATVKSLSKTNSILVDVSFPHDVKLKKDAGGNLWFTFILADQGGDWKWHQAPKAGGIQPVAGIIKAGTYTVTLPADGIPRSVLGDKKQVISIGPNTSGLVAPISFSIERIRGK